MSTTTTRRGRLQLKEGTTVPDGARAAAAARALALRPDEAEKTLDLDERFVDEGEIGRGGMSAVHRVKERSLNRVVALKTLPRELADDIAVKNRFLVEAQVTGQLEHPNIVPVYELGSDDAGTFFFTMRLIEGRSLTQLIDEAHDRHAEDWLEDALDVLVRVCDALSFAHSRGVVHRDVKPGNIMVGDHGQVYLVDWGIALVSSDSEPRPHNADRLHTTVEPAEEKEGTVMGTFAYMAPEQAWGDIDAIDRRTDVFGLGAVLYRILTGRPPYVAKRSSELLVLAKGCQIADSPLDVKTPLARALGEVALKAMRARREDRFQSVEELKSAVQEIRRGRGRFAIARYAAGSMIVQEGAQGDDAFIVREGRCQVYCSTDRGKVVLQQLGEGDVFGETAVFTGEPRTASVEALTDVEIVVVPGSALAQTMGLDTWTGAFVRALGTRFAEHQRRVNELESQLEKALSGCKH